MSPDFESFEEELDVVVVTETADSDEQPDADGAVAAADADASDAVLGDAEDAADTFDAGEPAAEVAPIATSFGTVTDRLSEIAEVMEDETLPLDDALDLLEEAVALGMQASNLLESDLNERDAVDEDAADEDAADEDAEAGEAADEAVAGAATGEDAQDATDNGEGPITE